ncbi:hypothetical protein SERLADRAFT_476198 [Serpula lacrymans var. lacrymans S7.9]|uniref:Uncharacterized protein n=1 Tax=Serpula lacrymans var. lacrymans (strain S7.9) TaxID=578457 RepID=F8P735_SERL9|nr:uncharacterized protein SERLADRAFT_476198 [Serpula lacrymans var. lacrymans S7.9]EGO21251.1 hypothetical protein SERLADRAFT_476198 [Serpula lacrymans var. lacrymans S7.9]
MCGQWPCQTYRVDVSWVSHRRPMGSYMVSIYGISGPCRIRVIQNRLILDLEGRFTGFQARTFAHVFPTTFPAKFTILENCGYTLGLENVACTRTRRPWGVHCHTHGHPRSRRIWA